MDIARKPTQTAKHLFICVETYSSVLNALFDVFKVITTDLAIKENELY